MLRTSEMGLEAGCVHSGRHSRRRFTWLWPSAFLAVGILVLASFFLPQPGPTPATAVAGPTGQATEAPPNISQKELLSALVRYGSRPEGLTPADFPGVDVLLATPTYFNFTGRQPPESPSGQPSLVFYVSESIHAGQLPALPAEPVLKVGRVYHQPAEVRALTDSPHHRTTLVRYNAAWSDGSPIIPSEARSLEMVFPAGPELGAPGSVISWELPVSYGPNYSSGEVFLGATSPTSAAAHDHRDSLPATGHDHQLDSTALPPLGAFPLPIMAIPALLGVILAALTPCLIDLALCYGAYLGGSGAAAGATGLGPARSALWKSALFFILGLTIVYTLGGAIAGQAGQVLQQFGLVIEWDRPIALIGGAIMILVAFRMAAGFWGPSACHLPSLKLPARITSGAARSTLMGSTFAARCFSCFSGTVISALILYAGASGSAVTGALVFFFFSLGLGAILLPAALLMNSFASLTFGLKRLRPALGLSSALVMIGFGATMILDKEHLFSDYVVHLLNLA